MQLVAHPISTLTEDTLHVMVGDVTNHTPGYTFLSNHGLFSEPGLGASVNTFSNRDRTGHWMKDQPPNDFPGCAVLAGQFHTPRVNEAVPFLGNASDGTLEGQAGNMLHALLRTVLATGIHHC